MDVDYFRWMSPLAGRISDDIALTRCAYQDLWESLSQVEKDQVINEAIVDPAVVLKYNSQTQVPGKIKANSKFSWFTKSQLDLFESLKAERCEHTTRKKGPAPEPPIRKDSCPTGQNNSDQNANVQVQNVPVQNVPTAPTQPLRVIVPSPVVAIKKRALIASPPSEPNNLFGRLKSRQKSEDRQPLVPTETSVSVIKTKTTTSDSALHPVVHPPGRLAKPKTPPPPPPTSNATTESITLLSHDEVDSIPKTGFDFLDNW